MEKENSKKSLSCRKAFIRHLRIFVSDGMANERKEIRRSRTETLRDDKTLYYNNVNGFTLIELLVVVLIIGILAAVALPQYQKAVEKSKATQALTLLKSISQAAEEYYLANGSEFTSFDDLSVDIPWTGNIKAHSGFSEVKSNNDWSLQLDSSTSGWVIIYIFRISGKYKGGGFHLVLHRQTTNQHTNDPIGCSELLSGSYAFSLSEGAYCREIMKGTLKSTDSFHRSYTL